MVVRSPHSAATDRFHGDTMSLDQNRVGVVGAGTMGTGIVQCFAQAGYLVELVDIDKKQLPFALKEISRNLVRLASKGVIDPTKVDTILGKIRMFTDIELLSPAPLIIESVPESFELKRDIFLKLDKLMPEETILASNTSAISITELGSATSRESKVIGMHFPKPAPLLNLIEIIRAISTSDETFKQVETIAHRLGKIAVEIQDYPGFVANRIIMPMINEAIYVLMEGVASAEDIDNVMKQGMNHPMGPLHLADFIGLDKCLAIMGVLFAGFSDPKYRPCPLLKKMVSAGYLGRKSGRGFFNYET